MVKKPEKGRPEICTANRYSRAEANLVSKRFEMRDCRIVLAKHVGSRVEIAGLLAGSNRRLRGDCHCMGRECEMAVVVDSEGNEKSRPLFTSPSTLQERDEPEEVLAPEQHALSRGLVAGNLVCDWSGGREETSNSGKEIK
jgi:hypothetical protein